MTRTWHEIRAEAVISGRINPQRVDIARGKVEATVRAVARQESKPCPSMGSVN